MIALLVMVKLFPLIKLAVLILPPVILPTAVIKPAVMTLPPVTLPVAVTCPAVRTLPPVTLPVAVTVPLVTICPPVMLPAALTTPAVEKSAPVMLPTAEIRPLTLRLPLVTLPVITTVFEALLKVNAALPAKISPSLNCTCVLAPPASTLPSMLPMKKGAVILPVAETMPVVRRLPA